MKARRLVSLARWGVGLVALAAAQGFHAPALAQEAPADSQEDAAAEAEQEGQAIVVTGSRVVRDGSQAPTPVTVVGSDRIEALAVTNVGELLNQLPAFRGTTTPSTSFVSISGNVGGRTADLRGLGPSRTLVLLDGRRFVPSTGDGTVDLNLIPTSLIGRVEIVTGGASAAYGSDAVAGVVNIILDSKLRGIRASAQYGETEEGDGETYQLSLGGGTSFADGRGSFVAGVEYEDSKGTGNCYSRSWCAEEWLPLANTTPGANGLPAINILPHSHAATMTQGGLINSPGPLRGIQFTDDGQPVPFTYGILPSTFFMAGGDGHGLNPFISAPLLRIPIERVSALAHAEYELSPALTLFADLSYGRVESTKPGAQIREFRLNISIDNPYIPAAVRQQMVNRGITSFVLGRQGDDFGLPIATGTNQTWRVAIGAKGEIGGGWHWDGYYQYGNNTYDQQITNNRNNANFALALNAVNGPTGPVCRVNADANPANDVPSCRPVNLFGQYQWTDAARDFIFGTSTAHAEIQQHVAAINVQRDLFSIGSASPVAVATGFEYRRDSIIGTADDVSLAAGWYTGNYSPVNGKIEVKEGYVELVAPLLENQPFANSLELNGAVRLTDYSTSGSVTTWKVGAIWEPIDAIRIRATRSRDIRAPNLTELFGAQTTQFTRVFDPVTSAEYLPIAIGGSNPDLQPEIADTWTAGIVITPYDLIPNLRISADWYDVNVRDAIGALGAQTIVDRCAAGVASLCDLITRNATSQITEIRNFQINVNRLITRGVDFELAYALPLGGADDRIDFRLLATYVKDLITDDGITAIDRAGQTGVQTQAQPGVPDILLNGLVSLKTGPFQVSAEGRYIPKGKYDATLIGPEDAGYSPSLANSISTNRVDDRFYLNLVANWTYELGAERELTLFAGINNVTDVDPPIAPSNGIGTNAIFFDTVGRSYRAGVRVKY